MSETQTNCAYRYTVRRGDSFYLIAQRTGVQLRDLLEANPDIPPARLTVGDVLCIPYCSTADTPAADQPDQGGGNTDCGNNGGENDNGGHTDGGSGYVCPANRRAVVQEGQTASDLQLRYNLSYHTLKTANADKDLDSLNGGDVICVPESNIACPLPASVVLGDSDTLETIATQYNVPIASLLRVNPCLAPEDFTAGVTVRLPD
ncbi:MAG: LysM peptidoglycan-binding domain-containing protein [Clostridia bacterium]|nr:LysM peptidoglycan-binding domain-containing protein [Clostridia bacterium]